MAHESLDEHMRDELYALKIEGRGVADAEVGEGDQRTGEDHFAHATGKICKVCGRTIEAGQAARLRGEGEWVHDVCPVITD